MNAIVAGLDIGATKCHLRFERADGLRVGDDVITTSLRASAPSKDRAHAVAELLDRHRPAGTHLIAVAVGAHGCDTSAQCSDLHAAISAYVRAPLAVVNDAELLVPATGEDVGIGVVAGTGSIAVGVSAAGERLWAGSGGWLLGDDGGAFGLVRAAARAVLAERDAGRKGDPLVPLLLAALGAADPADLSTVLTTTNPSLWAATAPTVFEAVEHGSAAALNVVRHSGTWLGDLVAALVARGAVADHVVAAGGVIVNQPMLYDCFVDRVQTVLRTTHITRLTTPPVVGAVALARRLAAKPTVSAGDPVPDLEESL